MTKKVTEKPPWRFLKLLLGLEQLTVEGKWVRQMWEEVKSNVSQKISIKLDSKSVL